MGNSYFKFKQFSIRQDRCAMKLSTDAVILGALAHHPDPGQILDIGTGTGVLALMLAQRYQKARVYGVELDPDAGNQANENVEGSPWGNRMEIIQTAFQDFSGYQKLSFDLMVSNPPFFTDHLLSPDNKRNMALHNQSLTFPQLWEGVDRSLSGKGLFWVILPPKEMDHFIKLGEVYNFVQQHSFQIRDRPEAKVHRNICAFKRGAQSEKKIDKLTLKDENGEYSLFYQELVRDFLLNF